MKIIAACQRCGMQYSATGMLPNERIHCRCGSLVTIPTVRASDARLVRCASCGAVRGKGGDNCEYCGARFSAVDKGWGSMCPRCFCRLPDDAQFCVECGLKIDPLPLQARSSGMNCPRCRIELQNRTLESISLTECSSCGGTWLPVSTFENICKQKETMSMASRGLNARGKRPKFELTDAEVVKYIPCPVCKNLMNRRNFAGISGVIIDTCRNCGVWLDNQELTRIIQFIESGGLENAREREAQEREHSLKMRELGADKKIHVTNYSFSTGGPPPDSSDIAITALVRGIALLARVFLK